MMPAGNAWKRVVELEGTSNFRDLGGYRTATGQTVRTGRLYRTASLASLTEGDVAVIGALGIRTICDLRGDEESRAAPTRLPAQDPPRVAALPIHVAGNLRALLGDGSATGEDMRRALAETYRIFVRNHTDAYRALFDHLVDEPGYPLVFHCSAGKDRTGLAAALVLSALDVPRHTVEEDYLLTNVCWTADVPYAAQLRPDMRDALLGAHPEYLGAAFDEIEHRHGSVAGFLAGPLGLTPDRAEILRRHLLD